MSPTVRRRKHRCLENLPRVALIEASAGTGKTYAIERMVAEFVLEDQLPIQRILVVTFTRKAASEMRARIFDALEDLLKNDTPDALEGEACWEITPEARGLLARAVADFDQAPISTIHSFCQAVLNEQLILTGAIRDGASPDTGALFHDAFVEHLRRIPVQGGVPREVLEQWIVLGNGIAELETLLSKAAEEVMSADDPLERIRPRISPAALGKLRKALLAAFAGPIPTDVEEVKDAGSNKRKEVIEAFHQVKLVCSDPELVALSPLAFQLRFLEAAQALVDGENRGFNTPETLEAGRVRDLLTACRELFLQAPTPESVVVHTFLPPVVQSFERACRKHGALDTDRLLRETLRAVREDTTGALKSRLRQRYRVALVDEFQDTDEVQWEILKAVFVDGKETRFVAVGDPKQAIYGFRGGDFDTYCRARARLFAGDTDHIPKGPDDTLPPQLDNLVLDENRRSTKAMVEAYNLILGKSVPGSRSGPPERFFREDVSGIRYGDKERVEAAGQVGELLDPDTGKPAPPLGLLHFHGAQSAFARIRIRAAVVREARRLVAGKAKITGGKQEGELGPRHLMVLVSTNWEARQYVEALCTAGVRAEQYRAQGLMTSPEADDVLEVLEALSEPERPVSFVKVMRTLFFDVPFEELEQLKVLPSSDSRLKTWRAWGKAAGRRDWVELFAAMREAAHVRRRLSLSADSERSLLAVHAVLDVVHRQARERCPDVGALLRRFKELQSGDEEGVETDDDIFPSSESDAVRVLTVYKAKGLEAPVVFLATAPHGAPRNGQIEHFHEGAPGAWRHRMAWVGSSRAHPAGERIALEADLEARRFQYVALTRAQYKLWLPLLTRDPNSKEKVGEPLADDGAAGPRYRAVNQRLLALMQDPAFQPLREIVDVDAGDVEVSPLLFPDTDPPAVKTPTPSPDTVRVSARGLQKGSFTSLHLTLPDQPVAEPAAEVKPEQMPRGTAAGTLLHAYLEHAPLETVKSGQALQAWLAHDKVKVFLAEREKFIPAGWKRPVQVDDLIRMVHAGLHLPVELQKGKWIEGLGNLALHREVDFYMPWPDGGGQLPSGRWRVENGFLNGSMDFVFEHQGRVYFGDWKSNALSGYGPEAIQRAVAASYEAQVRIYTLALCRAWGIADAGDYEKRFGGALYLFLRGFDGTGNGVGVFQPSWQALTELEARLKSLGDERARMPPERDMEWVESAGKPDKDDDDRDDVPTETPDQEAA